MRLSEALQQIQQSRAERDLDVHLLCGCTVLHLETFVKAFLVRRFPDAAPRLRTGLFGDLEGNLLRSAEGDGHGAIVIVEWSDLDPRLGFRTAAGWPAATLDDIVGTVSEKARRLEKRIAELAAKMPVAVAGPTLPLPPFTHLPPTRTSIWELRLNRIAAELRECLGTHRGVRLVSDSALAVSSPPASRHDLKLDLQAGFPYTLPHAAALADLGVSCLFPAAPKKGLITDLDQTLWKGILGDAGVDGISWSLEDKSQAHALYQQVLASLAEAGTLLAIASKNDPERVDAALGRPDLILRAGQIFPREVSWGRKSEAVGRILKTWNIAADSVVFVDDSPMELAEVSEAFPGLECLRFPSDDPAGILNLLTDLRAKFGKSEILEEDRLRLNSIRASAVAAEAQAGEASPDFLARLEARVTFEGAGQDRRAFELVNKTNQFNLNGLRYSEAEWQAMLARPGAFLATVSYEDRFGPLGRIAVLGGYRQNEVCHVDVWVLSCRAFSRQVEYQCIRELFQKTAAPELRFGFKPTDRNGPLQTFFGPLFAGRALEEGELCLSFACFERLCPQLFHEVIDKWTMSAKN